MECFDEKCIESSKLAVDAKLKQIIPEFYQKFHYLFQFKSEHSFEFNLVNEGKNATHNICKLFPIVNSHNEVDLVVAEIELGH